ncbi:hypothetical protein HNY73_017172 [Argiope bruennichi]|uniref:Uncharacterized protein n=1 Tax=Argiope bruennichi TaxID=94029 RepID=A0A8T0EKX8_ARGBR|nr:hypothetical protein HNY73_017172 [Argiope bruennichi]
MPYVWLYLFRFLTEFFYVCLCEFASAIVFSSKAILNLKKKKTYTGGKSQLKPELDLEHRVYDSEVENLEVAKIVSCRRHQRQICGAENRGARMNVGQRTRSKDGKLQTMLAAEMWSREQECKDGKLQTMLAAEMWSREQKSKDGKLQTMLAAENRRAKMIFLGQNPFLMETLADARADFGRNQRSLPGRRPPPVGENGGVGSTCKTLKRKTPEDMVSTY